MTCDGDGDGFNETTISGNATFSDDPADAGEGFGGQVAFALETVGGLGRFAGDMTFAITASGRQFSGSGIFTEVLTGNTTTVTIDPGQPFLMKAATGTGDAIANACGYSLEGDVAVLTTGSGGSLSSIWSFDSSRADVTVTDTVFTALGGATTNLPDASVHIPCGGNGGIADWSGTYLQRWACLPPEYGEAQFTITVTGANTIRIADEDPPGSGDTNSYEATAVPGNPHVVRGFFVSGTAGSTYREEFTWTLVPNSQRFTQISQYRYLEGAYEGTGGLCGGSATRTP